MKRYAVAARSLRDGELVRRYDRRYWTRRGAERAARRFSTKVLKFERALIPEPIPVTGRLSFEIEVSDAAS